MPEPEWQLSSTMRCGLLGRKLGDQNCQLLVGEVEGVVAKPAVEEDNAFVLRADVECVELECGSRSRAVAAILKHRDVIAACLAKMFAKLIDDICPRGVSVLQDDNR